MQVSSQAASHKHAQILHRALGAAGAHAHLEVGGIARAAPGAGPDALLPVAASAAGAPLAAGPAAAAAAAAVAGCAAARAILQTASCRAPFLQVLPTAVTRCHCCLVCCHDRMRFSCADGVPAAPGCRGALPQRAPAKPAVSSERSPVTSAARDRQLCSAFSVASSDQNL